MSEGKTDQDGADAKPATAEQIQQWQSFKAEQVPQALSEASRLSQQPTKDESNPYEPKYEAARVLENCGRQAAAFRDTANGDVQLVACILIAARGLVLADTERHKDGECSLTKAMAALDRSGCQCWYAGGISQASSSLSGCCRQPRRFAALLQQVGHL